MAAIDAGAEDVREDGDKLRVLCDPSDLTAVREALEDAGVEIESAAIATEPKSTVEVEGPRRRAAAEAARRARRPGRRRRSLRQLRHPRERARGARRLGRDVRPEGIRPGAQNPLPMQVVMGIDPGAANLGFGIVRVEGNRMVALDGGVVETTPEQPMEQRLERIHRALAELIAWHEPKAMAIEEVYFGKNVQLGDGGRPGQRGRDAGRRPARHRLLRLHAAGDQDGRLRLRRRRQGPGPADGRDAARAARAADPRPRRRRARGGDLPRRRQRPPGGGRWPATTTPARWRQRGLAG